MKSYLVWILEALLFLFQAAKTLSHCILYIGHGWLSNYGTSLEYCYEPRDSVVFSLGCHDSRCQKL